MRALIILLSIFISACSSVAKQPQPDVQAELKSLRDAFFNQTSAKQALANLSFNADAPKQAGLKPEAYFDCSRNALVDAEFTETPIDFQFEEMDLHDALMEISVMLEVPIMMDDSVEGIVTGNFAGKNIEEVLSTLLSIGEYDYRIFSDHIFVGSTEVTSSSYHQLSRTCIYRPANQDAISLASLLPEFYQRYIKLNKQNGFIAITATNSMMERIQHDIVLFDMPQKQVVMELSVIEVSTEALEILGLDWQTIQGKASAVYNQNLATSYTGRTVALPVMQARHFLDAVNALKRTGNAEIKTMPSIVVMEGKEAKFKSQQTTWTPELMANSQKKEDIQYGVEMNVVPYVSQLGDIQLNINNATVSDFVSDGEGLPRLVSHSISSSVNVKNGDSLIIGGLLQKKERHTTSGVPWMSDIPLLGSVFSKEIKSIEETEVLIIIQPKVL